MIEQKVIESNVLLPYIEQSYREEYTEYSQRNIRFSDAGAGAQGGEKCERSLFYSIKRPDEKRLLSSQSLVLFDDGRIAESDIRRRLRLILRSPERELYDEQLSARGKIDNTVYLSAIKKELPEELQKITEDPGLEIKSVNEFTYQEMAKSKQIKQSYYDQIQMYLYATGKPFFFVIIKNRNSIGHKNGILPYLEFIVSPDADRQKEIRSSLIAVKHAINTDVLPPRPFLRESTQCQFCRYNTLCWELLTEKVQEQEISEEPIPLPTQEMVESAVKAYKQSTQKMNDLKEQQEEARQVLLNYFKATGENSIVTEDIAITYSKRESITIDVTYLQDTLTQSQYNAIVSPDRKKLAEAVMNRLIDGIVYERAKKVAAKTDMIRMSKRQQKLERQTVVKKKRGRPKKTKKGVL